MKNKFGTAIARITNVDQAQRMPASIASEEDFERWLLAAVAAQRAALKQKQGSPEDRQDSVPRVRRAQLRSRMFA